MPKWTFNDETDEFTCDSLYFIQEGVDGPIKIGRGRPAERLKAFQTGNPRELRLIAEIANGGYMESFWHKAFGSLRMRGEWFAADTSLLEAIKWALQEEHWADEVRAPDGVSQFHYSELMLDAFEIYREHMWNGVPEGTAATKAMAYVDYQTAEYL